MLTTIIGDAAGVAGVLSALVSWHMARVKRWKAEAAKWQAVAERLDETNDLLRDQNRDLRTVALVDERVRALRAKGTEQCS